MVGFSLTAPSRNTGKVPTKYQSAKIDNNVNVHPQLPAYQAEVPLIVETLQHEQTDPPRQQGSEASAHGAHQQPAETLQHEQTDPPRQQKSEVSAHGAPQQHPVKEPRLQIAHWLKRVAKAISLVILYSSS